MKNIHEKFMFRAIEIAIGGTGKVSPNPRVGAVIVKDGIIVGEGYHKFFGGNHAEVEAIKNSGLDDFKDCTMYINLEPCSHYGKTPPCANLLVEKGFKRVVIGMIDPNPLVSGKGIEILKDGGIEVITNVLYDDCYWLNRSFSKFIKTGKPYIIIKIAQSLNGNIATNSGESQWITCLESRKRGHVLRASSDAVLIGKRTAYLDNSQLTVREVSGINPKRIIFDTNLNLPQELKIFTDDFRHLTILCCKPESAESFKAKSLLNSGIKILPVWLNNEGTLNIEDALNKLAAEHKVTSILVEGGGRIISSFIKYDFFDEIHFFIAPILIANGINAIKDFTTDKLIDSQKLKFKAISNSGEDLHIIAVKKS